MKLITTIFILIFGSWSTIVTAQTPTWVWAEGVGGTGDDQGRNVSTDANGNVFMTGRFSSTSITFGLTTLVTAGSADIFLAKYDSSGNVIWARSAGGLAYDDSYSVAADFNGNVFVAGRFYSDSINFGATTLMNAGGNDIFIVKYDAGGNVLWAKSAGGPDDETGYSVTTDSAGNVFMSGRFTSASLNFGAITIYKTGFSSIFIVKYDANGNELWARSVGSGNTEIGYSVSADPVGNVIMTGRFRGASIIFGSDTLLNNGKDDIFIVKYDAGGNVVWSKSAGGSEDEIGHGVSIDSNGNIFITGRFASPSMTLGSTTLATAGIYDIFIVKYDSAGNELWAKRAGGPSSDESYSVAADPEGNVFITGLFYSQSLSFGSSVITNAGSCNIFIVKYDSVGNVIWAKSAGGTSGDQSYGLATDATGNLFMTGAFYSPSLSFGNTVLTNSGSSDIFITKNALCFSTASVLNVTECGGWISPSGNYIYASTGTYYDTIPNYSGCDSVLTINLTINPSPVVTVTALGSTNFCQGDSVILSASPGLTSYQWYNRNLAISGATSENFTTKSAGKFKCLAQNALLCSDTSNIIVVRVPCIQTGPNHLRVEQGNDLGSHDLRISPNPGCGIFKLTSSPGQLQVYDSKGVLIISKEVINEENTFDISGFADGIYIVNLRTESLSQSLKFILSR